MPTTTTRTSPNGVPETRLVVLATTNGVERAVATIPVRLDDAGRAFAQQRAEAYATKARAAGATVRFDSFTHARSK